jgi:O-antigen biosynthesis protein
MSYGMSARDSTSAIFQPQTSLHLSRPEVKGRFLFDDDRKFCVRGVTYGPFGPGGSSDEYHNVSCVERDFAQIASSGFNAIRTYTVPPVWLLDIAAEHGLRVMVGLPWEQHITFLDDRRLSADIVRRVRADVRSCAGHPAVLCYAIGNEIPASIVRWHGAPRVERFIRTVFDAAKDQDFAALFTYVNYPSTEYLQLPFLDLVSFNIYLHSSSRLADYLARLMNLAGDRPLLIAEIGMDSRRHGEFAQGKLLADQVRTVSSAGCVGTFVFAWTDEWHRGGVPVEDWDFGLTRRDRTAKIALTTVTQAFALETSEPATNWPRVTVVLCSYNGERYIGETLSAIQALDYGNYEVIVVDDGSTDATAAIASRYPVRLIRTKNLGLSSARNTGAKAATGDIVAYIDDDAYPDPDWLKHLARVFLCNPDYAGVGGPNIPPPGDSLVAQCVAHAPGGPLHVLLSDREAEHIPGCNMAFRRTHLLAIGGFDLQFRAAGDDVDVCWRIQEQGWKLGFSPAATVFHHRRGTLRAYWKQQVGYGKAEAILERKWPDKYNAAGYLTWAGRIYNARGFTPLWWRRGRIYQGTWGAAAYQRLYQPAATLLGELPLLPDWYLVILFLAMLSLISLAWKPLVIVIPLLGFSTGLSLLQAVTSAAIASSFTPERANSIHVRVFAISVLLHLMQPLARLYGRFKYGLHPWRHRGLPALALPRPRTVSIWTEAWQSGENWLQHLQKQLRRAGAMGRAGGGYDDWDLEIQGGVLAAARVRMAVEEHGSGRQMLRFRIWPRCSGVAFLICVAIACISFIAAYDQSWTAAGLLLGMSAILGGRIFYESALATHKITAVLADFADDAPGTRRNGKALTLRAVARNS